MADNTQKTITIDVNKLPEGIDASKLVEIVERAQKADERAKRYNEIRRKAQAELAKLYPTQYKQLLKKYGTEVK